MTSHYTLMAIGRRRTYCPDLRFSNAHVLALRSRFRSSKYVFRHLAYMTIQPRPPPLQGGPGRRPGCHQPNNPHHHRSWPPTARPDGRPAAAYKSQQPAVDVAYVGRAYPARRRRPLPAAVGRTKTSAEGSPMNSDDLGRLMAAWLGSVPRLPDAKCRGETWLADLDVRSSREAIDAAIDVCLDCPVMLACAEWVEGLSPDQNPAGVTASRLIDPRAYQAAKSAMAAELKAGAPQPASPKPRRRARLRQRLLAVAEAAGPDGVTVAEARAELYGAYATGTHTELARQGLQRLVGRGVLVRVDRGGRARYAPAQMAVAS